MKDFTIKSLYATTHDSSYGGYPFKVVATITMDSKEWSKIKRKRGLGMLYGVDISNAIHDINSNINAYNPSVSDSKRASKGIKTITLTYYDKSFERAEALGLEVMRMKNGESYIKYGSHVSIGQQDSGVKCGHLTVYKGGL